MTELALLIALSLIGLALSFGFGRLEVKRGAVTPTLRRIEAALERAAVSTLRLAAARGLWLVGVVAIGLVGSVVAAGAAGMLSVPARAVFLLVALAGGASSSLLFARLSLGLAARAASCATAFAARGSSRQMRPLLRAAAALAVFGDCLAVLGLAGAFAALYAILGGFAGPPRAELATEIVKLLPAYALGAALSALSLTREGCVLSGAARLGALESQELGLDADDVRDPALLASLVGQLTGELLPRALSSYVGSLAAIVAAALLAASSQFETPATAVLALFVLIRAFGAIGSLAGVYAARAVADEPASKALWRSHWAALVVTLFGIGAALFWLERARLAALLTAAVAGLAAAQLVSVSSCFPLRRAVARESAELRSGGEAAAISRGVGAALASVWPALVAPALALGAIERALQPLGQTPLVLLAFAAGASSLGPLAVALSGLGLLGEQVRGLASLGGVELESRPSSRLEQALAWGAASGTTHGTFSAALAALLGLWSLIGGAAALANSIGAFALACGLGLVLVLRLSVRTAQSAASGSRLVSAQVQAQLGEATRGGLVAPPPEFAPSYKACVDAALEAARGSSTPELCALLSVPFALPPLLRGAAFGTAGATLFSFGVAGVAGGLMLSFAGRGVRAALREARRRRRGGELTRSGASQAGRFGELVGVTSAAAAEAFAPVLALTILCLAPLLR